MPEDPTALLGGVLVATSVIVGMFVLRRRLRTWRSLWRRRRLRCRLGYGPDRRFLVTVPAEEPSGLPGFTLIAPSRPAFVRRLNPAGTACEELGLFIGRRSSLKVVRLRPPAGSESLLDRVLRAATGLDGAGAMTEPPTATGLGGEPALRWTFTFSSGDTLTEWHVDHRGWHYAVGVFCKGSAAEAASDRARGESALATWQWLPNRPGC